MKRNIITAIAIVLALAGILFTMHKFDILGMVKKMHGM
jgi:hypothetical protein